MPTEHSLSVEAGFTLVELVVGMAVALVAFTATLYLMVSSMRTQTSVQRKVSQLEQAQLGVQRLVRELRQASAVTVTNSTAITYTEPALGGNQNVTFSCTSTCTRAVAGAGTQIAITNVANSDIFSGSPNGTSPTYVSVKLVITATGHTPVTLADGVGLRNVTLGS